MKKIVLYLIALSLFTACSLDQKNQDEISGDNIINTTQKAYGVLSQAYINLPMEPSPYTMLSEDIQPSYLINNNASTKEYYNWRDVEIAKTADRIWAQYYSSIAHLNALLASEKYMSNNSAEWNFIKGNVLTLKAYVYFDLLQLYSKRYEPSALGILPKEVLEIQNNARVTQLESIVFIKTLLDQGIALMEGTGSQTNYFITIPAAENLKAQIALYTKDYEGAEKIAKKLVARYPTLPSTEKEYASLWQTSLEKGVSETYWVYNYQQNPNAYLLFDKVKGDLFYINHFVSFDKQDIRYDASQYFYTMSSLDGVNKDRALLGKYKTSIATNEARNIVLSRNTETYFILIESLIEQNKLNEATQIFNTFLGSINNPILEEGNSQNTLRLLMQSEKQKEFIGEKINLFDLKRWNVAISRYLPDSNNRLSTIANADFRWVWPIPDSEMRYNSNAIQNEGWLIIK